MGQKVDQKQKTLILNNHLGMQTTEACRKSSKNANISALTLRSRKGNHVSFKFALDSPRPHLLIKQLNLVFDNLKSAAKLNVA